MNHRRKHHANTLGSHSYQPLEPRQLLATVAIDLGSANGVPATLSSFQAVDPNLPASTTFVRDSTSVQWSAGALDTTYDGLTFSTAAGDQGAPGFQASNGNWTTDVPLIDSYTVGRSTQSFRDELTLDISGFAALPIGQTITLTAWGIGDNPGQQTAFSSTFGGTSSTQETFFGTNDAGNGAVPFVQFTFTTNGTTDVLNLTPDRATASGTSTFIPINGISLSVVGSQLPLLSGAHPLINEFSASNSDVIEDDNENSSDWIEIYNAGDTSINLAGYTLTDDAAETDKYVFPSTILTGGQYLVVFAGDDADPTSGTDLYTEFGLSSAGEYLGFFDPAGNLVSEFGPNGSDYPAQFTDVSYGLVADGDFDTSSFFATATPGSMNINEVDGVTSRVTSSVAPGFYSAADNISVQLSTDTVGASIYYTTNGSTPTNTNGTLYTGSIPITSTTTLRAVSVKDGFLSDFDRTWSYLFVDDIINQDSNPPTNEWPTQKGNNIFDYGIDPDVVDIEGQQAVKDALLSIPSWSITTDLDNLFDEQTGIYENSLQSGREWERPASVEQLNPDGTEGFQVNAGIRIRGGFSRGDANPKHSFRLFFRSEYGDSELNYPVLGDRGVDTFDKIDLRTAQNYSWSKEGNASSNFIQDVISRQNQGLSGELVTKSSWLHLYINGQYWGLYQTQERAEANFAASYLGGDPDDYDVVKVDSGRGASRHVEATDGDLFAYTRLYDQATALASDGSKPAFVNNADYLRAQGLNPDGSRNPNFEVLLDVDNLVNYMTEILYSGNFDAPITNFGGNDSLNNFYAIRDRTGDEGFKFFVHDAEHSLRVGDSRSENRNGPYNDSEFERARSFNPQTLHQKLMANEEYRLQFADAIQEKFFNDGFYTFDNVAARWDAEAAKISSAIIAESARWGDAQTSTPFLKSNWQAAIDNTRDNFLEGRGSDFLDQLRNTIIRIRDGSGNYTIDVDAPLFPGVDAPSFEIDGSNQSGGTIAAGDSLTFVADDTVYYTTDGTDPREFGGGVSSNAIFYNPGVVNTTLVNFGDNWNYLADGSNQGTAWRSVGFNDSSWDNDPSQLGYGDGDEATEVDEFAANGDKIITTYFRTTFDLAAGDYSDATLDLIRDDAAVVYLNGVELWRSNFNASTNVLFNTFADQTASPANENNPVSFDFDPALLVVGSNTLAIEIHQVSLGSSDVSFDAKLSVSSQSNVAGIPLNTSTNVKARTFSNGEWSAVHDATFAIPGSQSDLRISEIQFNPSEPTDPEDAAGFTDNDDFEFIELFNPNIGSSINLNGVQLSDGVRFEFGDFDLLPGERVVVVEDVDAFMTRYGNDATVLGQWSGALNNGGEEIVLLDSSMDEIMSVNYGDNDPWYNAADGHGFSLVLEDPINTPVDELGKYYSWRASTEFGGTPGTSAKERLGVVVNEVLAHTDAPQSDSIELFNTTSVAVNVSGWYLSDEGDDLLKYQIPAGTVIAAGGYVVFDESDFNVTANGFALSSSEGDQVYLSQASAGVFAGLQDAVEFDATFNGESVGRLPDGTGRLTPLASSSFGSANGVAKVGPLVISEVNYHPANPSAGALAIDSTLTDNDLEYIEVANPTSAAVDLTGWRLRGEADFDFVAGTSLAAGEAILVVSFNPQNANKLAAFEAHYSIGAGVTIVGGLSASLSNSTGRIALQQPDTPDDLGFIPRVVVDEIVYDDLAPWPDADGSGESLERYDVNASGSFSTSWIAATPTPGVFESPFLLGDINQDGVVDFDDISPLISILASQRYQAEADIDGNGFLDFDDISPFITLLSSQ